MRAITQASPGAPLTWGYAGDPTPAAGEVLVAVEAAGVNRADLFQAAGGYAPPAGVSPTIGLEVAGTIAALGDGVEHWAVGDRVCALLGGGGYAEYAVVPVGQLLPAPLDAVGSAALPEAACTIYSNLAMIAGLEAGETVLIHGGSSGVGTFGIQWAHAIGARVFVTVGSGWKADRIRSLGAEIIDYHQQDFAAIVRDAGGADVVLDIVGVPYLARNIDALADDGHLVLLGGDLSDTEVPLSVLRAKRGSLTVSMLRARPPAQKAGIVAAVLRDVWPLDIHPVIDRVLPIADAAEAHRALAAGEVVGKVVLAL